MDFILIRLGLGIFLLLGSLHLIYSFMDLKNPKRFVPKDKSLLPLMRQTHIAMRKDAKDFWASSLGFHFSHSLGILAFALTFFILSFIAPTLLFNPYLMGLMLLVSAAYALLAHFFWFIIPLVGSLLAIALLVAGLFVH